MFLSFISAQKSCRVDSPSRRVACWQQIRQRYSSTQSTTQSQSPLVTAEFADTTLACLVCRLALLLASSWQLCSKTFTVYFKNHKKRRFQNASSCRLDKAEPNWHCCQLTLNKPEVRISNCHNGLWWSFGECWAQSGGFFQEQWIQCRRRKRQWWRCF